MPMSLPFATNVQAARAAAAELPGSQHDYFDNAGREVIAQAVLTLTVKQGKNWTAIDLIEQISAPRETFDASGLEDGRMDNIVFKAEPRQRDGVIASAVYMAQKAFGSPPSEGTEPPQGIAA